jgi:VWFA-related protein
MKRNSLHKLSALFCVFAALAATSLAQTVTQAIPSGQLVRTYTIPISIYTKQEMQGNQSEEFVRAERLIVKEDKEEQTILSIRSVSSTPLALAILIQDDITSSFNLQLKSLRDFIRNLPQGSRVMIAYVQGGSMQVRQRFTDNLDMAADSLRIVTSSPAAAPRSPYDSVVDALNRFDALPIGRRAMLLVSDGLDTSQGVVAVTPASSSELDRAIKRAQRRSVAVYSIYSPATLTANGSPNLVLAGQGSLEKLADETGGRAFFQGSTAAVSFDPFFRDLVLLLNRQFVLTFLSTHMKKGYHKLEVTSTNPAVKIEHPRGYYYR